MYHSPIPEKPYEHKEPERIKLKNEIIKKQGNCIRCQNTGMVTVIENQEIRSYRCFCLLGDPNVCLPGWIGRIKN